MPQLQTLQEQQAKPDLTTKTYKSIVLINPAYAVETGKDRKETYQAAILPPLGMLTLAGELEKHHYIVHFIDAEVELMTDEDMLKKIVALKPDVVGMYCISANFQRLTELSKKIKQNVGSLIFFGGPHVWHNWAETVNSGAVDFAVVGEGEKTCVELLDKLNKQEPLGDIKGVAYKDKDRVAFAGARPFLTDLNELAYAAFHLVDINKYKPSPQHVLRRPSVTMMAARGCPFRCTFCYVPYLFEGTYRTRSVDHVIGEIKSLVEQQGVKEVQFMDDLFGANKKWLEEFLDRLIAEKIDITWSCLTRLDIMDWRLARKMKQAGCWCIFFGMESLDQEVLNAINKRQTVEQIERAIKACQEIGIQIRANFILGSPTETPEKARKMIQRICELNPDYVKFNVMCPYPGTTIYKQVKEEGKWGKLIEDYDSDKLTNHEIVFVPFGYKNAEEVAKMRTYAYRKYYFRPRYLWSRIKSIHSWYDVVRYWRGFKLIYRRYGYGF